MKSSVAFDVKKALIYSVGIIFLVSSFFHFMYQLSGQNFIVGLFVPINESVWEHLKMVVLPIIGWWSYIYATKGKEYAIDINKWFSSALISLLTALITIPMLYYFYTSAFGVELLVVDILILFIAVLLGQLLAFHYYKYGKGFNYKIIFVVFLIIIFMFMYFTINPPNLPIFIEG